MATTFPAVQDIFTNPVPANKLNNPSHSTQHQNANDAIIAIEAKLGTGASTPANNTFLIGNGAGTSAFSSITSAQLAARLTDETGTGVAVFATTPTLVTPVLGAATGTSLALGGGTALTTTNQTGTGNLVLATSPTLTTPRITTSINDTNGNEIIRTPATGSAVNELTITNSATLTPVSITATGDDTNIDIRGQGKGTGRFFADYLPPQTYAATSFYDHVVSGGVWTADSVGVNLNASMTAIVCVINGRYISIGAVTARAFTTNVDTYIDVLDNADGTGTVVYTTAATNAASPALAANSLRIGIIQAAATITATTKVNQGQEDRVFPIASSIPYAVTDSIGNLICPRDSSRRTLGYRQIISNFTTATSGSAVDITGLSVPYIVPTGRKVKATYANYHTASTHAAGSYVETDITDNSNVVLAACLFTSAGSSYGNSHRPEYGTTPASASNTWKARVIQSGTGTITVTAGSTTPSFLRIELV